MLVYFTIKCAYTALAFPADWRVWDNIKLMQTSSF